MVVCFSSAHLLFLHFFNGFVVLCKFYRIFSGDFSSKFGFFVLEQWIHDSFSSFDHEGFT